jgi:low temperature requirement protein LtrA
VVVALGGLTLLFALWWLYFLEPAGAGLARRRHRVFVWAYGHYGIFVALAAIGAGLEVAVERTGHHLGVSVISVGYAVAIPVSVFLVLLWGVHAPIVRRPVIPPVQILSAAAVIVLVPLVAELIGLAAVIAIIAGVCWTLVVTTILSLPEDRTERLADLGV